MLFSYFVFLCEHLELGIVSPVSPKPYIQIDFHSQKNAKPPLVLRKKIALVETIEVKAEQNTNKILTAHTHICTYVEQHFRPVQSN